MPSCNINLTAKCALAIYRHEHYLGTFQSHRIWRAHKQLNRQTTKYFILDNKCTIKFKTNVYQMYTPKKESVNWTFYFVPNIGLILALSEPIPLLRKTKLSLTRVYDTFYSCTDVLYPVLCPGIKRLSRQSKYYHFFSKAWHSV